MQFKIKVKNSDGTIHWEKYDKPELHTEAQVQQWAVDTIRRFNADLRPGELRREIIRVWTFGDSQEHTWDKLSLVTEPGGFDRMQCRKCGITGKRYGLGQSGVQLDKEFQKKRYIKCIGHLWKHLVMRVSA